MKYRVIERPGTDAYRVEESTDGVGWSITHWHIDAREDAIEVLRARAPAKLEEKDETVGDVRVIATSED